MENDENFSENFTEPEVLVTISLRFPALGSNALAQHMSPFIAAAIALGGIGTTISFQPYNPEDSDIDE